MNTVSLLYKTSTHIRYLYNSIPHEDFKYHNLAHTEEVVRIADLIAGHCQLPELDYLALLIAGWFHDAGYLFANEEHHVEKSAEMAAEFLEKEKVEPVFIDAVQQAIYATKMPQNPTSEIGKILCDADLYHFGTDNFKTTDLQVREETQLRIKQEISDDVWYSIGYKLLEKHQFHTEYCQKILQSGKEKNMDRLQRLQDKAIAQKDSLAVKTNPDNLPEEKKDKKNKVEKNKEGKIGKAGRGVETMFRVTATNQMRLSDMADNKAHILLTINSVIISVIVSFLFRKISQEPWLLIPGILFMVTSLVTLVSAILVTRPKVSHGIFTNEDIKNRKVNLMFFGNYHFMQYPDYEAGIKDMMRDKEYLYESLIRDNFNLGIVLDKKYRKLRFAYGFFMFGFVISVVSFLIAELFFAKETSFGIQQLF